MKGAVFMERLRARGLRVAVAESCTGGLLGAELSREAGASMAFCGGVIAYSNQVKQELLGVSSQRLEAGAASASVVEAMASGVRKRCHADMGVAISGVAGPDGGSKDKPVGTVWIAVAGPGDLLEAHRLHLPGGRNEIRAGAVDAAIEHALAALDEAEKERLV